MAEGKLSLAHCQNGDSVRHSAFIPPPRFMKITFHFSGRISHVSKLRMKPNKRNADRALRMRKKKDNFLPCFSCLRCWSQKRNENGISIFRSRLCYRQRFEFVSSRRVASEIIYGSSSSTGRPPRSRSGAKYEIRNESESKNGDPLANFGDGVVIKTMKPF